MPADNGARLAIQVVQCTKKASLWQGAYRGCHHTCDPAHIRPIRAVHACMRKQESGRRKLKKLQLARRLPAGASCCVLVSLAGRQAAGRLVPPHACRIPLQQVQL